MSIKSTLIADKKFYIRVITIVLPMIIQNTVTNVASLLDNVMVGAVGTLQMSAVAIANQLIFVFNLCIFGGLAGAGIFLAQYAGAGDEAGIRYCFRAKLIIGGLVFLLAAGIFLALPKQLVSLYLAEGTEKAALESTLGFGVKYLRIMVIGLLPFTLTQIYSSTLREVGETRLPMIASVIAIFINLIFNYILIFGKLGLPRLGVVGAAIATVFSRFVEFAIIAVAAFKRKKQFTFFSGAFSSLYMPKPLANQMITKGMPLFVNEFLWSAGMAVMLGCYSVRGLDVVAAMNISNTVNNLFNVVFITMGNAVAIIIGQHLGANEIKQAKAAVWHLLTLAVATCAVMGTALAIVAPIVPDIYNTEPQVKAMATQFLFVVAALMPVYAFAHNCYFTIRSGGRTMVIFLFDSAFTWVIAVPLALFLANKTALPILPLYFCVQSLEFVKCAVGFILVKKGLWIRNLVAK